MGSVSPAKPSLLHPLLGAPGDTSSASQIPRGNLAPSRASSGPWARKENEALADYSARLFDRFEVEGQNANLTLLTASREGDPSFLDRVMAGLGGTWAYKRVAANVIAHLDFGVLTHPSFPMALARTAEASMEKAEAEAATRGKKVIFAWAQSDFPSLAASMTRMALKGAVMTHAGVVSPHDRRRLLEMKGAGPAVRDIKDAPADCDSWVIRGYEVSPEAYERFVARHDFTLEHNLPYNYALITKDLDAELYEISEKGAGFLTRAMRTLTGLGKRDVPAGLSPDRSWRWSCSELIPRLVAGLVDKKELGARFHGGRYVTTPDDIVDARVTGPESLVFGFVGRGSQAGRLFYKALPEDYPLAELLSDAAKVSSGELFGWYERYAEADAKVAAAVESLQKGQPVAARRSLEQALAAVPDHPGAHAARAALDRGMEGVDNLRSGARAALD